MLGSVSRFPKQDAHRWVSFHVFTSEVLANQTLRRLEALLHAHDKLAFAVMQNIIHSDESCLDMVWPRGAKLQISAGQRETCDEDGRRSVGPGWAI